MAADIIDNACALEELHRQESLNKHKNNNTHRPLVIDGVRYCLDCEEDISERTEILPDAVRCLICQEQFERQLGMRF